MTNTTTFITFVVVVIVLQVLGVVDTVRRAFPLFAGMARSGRLKWKARAVKRQCRELRHVASIDTNAARQLHQLLLDCIELEQQFVASVNEWISKDSKWEKTARDIQEEHLSMRAEIGELERRFGGQLRRYRADGVHTKP